jgi:hypothetical protein
MGVAWRRVRGPVGSLSSDFESGGQGFESLPARHFALVHSGHIGNGTGTMSRATHSEHVISDTYRRSSGRLIVLTWPIFSRAFAVGNQRLCRNAPSHCERTLPGWDVRCSLAWLTAPPPPQRPSADSMSWQRFHVVAAYAELSMKILSSFEQAQRQLRARVGKTIDALSKCTHRI